jgi:hypothetical protein
MRMEIKALAWIELHGKHSEREEKNMIKPAHPGKLKKFSITRHEHFSAQKLHFHFKRTKNVSSPRCTL